MVRGRRGGIDVAPLVQLGRHGGDQDLEGALAEETDLVLVAAAPDAGRGEDVAAHTGRRRGHGRGGQAAGNRVVPNTCPSCVAAKQTQFRASRGDGGNAAGRHMHHTRRRFGHSRVDVTRPYPAFNAH